MTKSGEVAGRVRAGNRTRPAGLCSLRDARQSNVQRAHGRHSSSWSVTAHGNALAENTQWPLVVTPFGSLGQSVYCMKSGDCLC